MRPPLFYVVTLIVKQGFFNTNSTLQNLINSNPPFRFRQGITEGHIKWGNAIQLRIIIYLHNTKRKKKKLLQLNQKGQ